MYRFSIIKNRPFSFFVVVLRRISSSCTVFRLLRIGTFSAFVSSFSAFVSSFSSFFRSKQSKIVKMVTFCNTLVTL